MTGKRIDIYNQFWGETTWTYFYNVPTGPDGTFSYADSYGGPISYEVGYTEDSGATVWSNPVYID